MIFPDARLKIQWANEHIAKLDGRLSRLPDRCSSTIQINPHTGNEVIKYDPPDAAAVSEIALITGDAIHNLRCALDYAWVKTLDRVAPSIIDNSTKFPVRDSANELEATMKGRKIDTLSPKLFRLVTDNIRPYQGGNFAVWSIHKLNNTDKHKLLIPFVQYTGIVGIDMETESGESVPNGFTRASTEPLPYYLEVPKGWKVKDKGKVALSILFDKVALGCEFRTLDCMSAFSSFTLAAVETLENF